MSFLFGKKFGKNSYGYKNDLFSFLKFIQAKIYKFHFLIKSYLRFYTKMLEF